MVRDHPLLILLLDSHWVSARASLVVIYLASLSFSLEVFNKEFLELWLCLSKLSQVVIWPYHFRVSHLWMPGLIGGINLSGYFTSTFLCIGRSCLTPFPRVSSCVRFYDGAVPFVEGLIAIFKRRWNSRFKHLTSGGFLIIFCGI